MVEYSKNYSKTSGSLGNYYRDEPNNPPLEDPVGDNPPTVNYNASFKYKSSIIGKIPNYDNDDNNVTDSEIVVPLRHLSNFW